MAVLVGLPAAMVVVFRAGERSLQAWLREGFDADVALLETIASGRFGETHAGEYLESFQRTFAPEVVADMFCLLQVSLELAVRAKGDLMSREAGFEPLPDPEIRAKLDELDFLERTVGPTARRALVPLLAGGSRDVWQLRLLGRE
jgi:hypothetical protein